MEACRIVEINPRTGKRWRHGRTVTARDGRKLHYAPVITRGAVVRREISDRYLSEEERVQIADLDDHPRRRRRCRRAGHHREGRGQRSRAGKLTMDLRLKGRRAVVTGSSGGIGEAITRRLAAEGAAVVVHGRRADGAAVSLFILLMPRDSPGHGWPWSRRGCCHGGRRLRVVYRPRVCEPRRQ